MLKLLGAQSLQLSYRFVYVKLDKSIHFKIALKEHDMVGYPKGIRLLFQINYLYFYHDSENPCFYSNNQKYKAGDSERYSCKKEDK